MREESLSQSASAQITEQMAKDDVLSRQIAPQLNTGTFAMQSEDFPALPGSQTPHQNAILCEPDGIEAADCVCTTKAGYRINLGVIGKQEQPCCD